MQLARSFLHNIQCLYAPQIQHCVDSGGSVVSPLAGYSHITSLAVQLHVTQCRLHSRRSPRCTHCWGTQIVSKNRPDFHTEILPVLSPSSHRAGCPPPPPGSAVSGLSTPWFPYSWANGSTGCHCKTSSSSSSSWKCCLNHNATACCRVPQESVKTFEVARGTGVSCCWDYPSISPVLESPGLRVGRQSKTIWGEGFLNAGGVPSVHCWSGQGGFVWAIYGVGRPLGEPHSSSTKVNCLAPCKRTQAPRCDQPQGQDTGSSDAVPGCFDCAGCCGHRD